MSDERGFPDEVFNVSSRGTSFFDLGWDGHALELVRRSAEQVAGGSFSDREWANCTRPAEIDLLIAATIDRAANERAENNRRRANFRVV